MVLSPILTWMTQNQRPVETALEDAGLAFISLEDPFQIIPLHSLARLLSNETRQEGPDLPIRLIYETDVLSGAMIAPIVAAARTPREAFSAIATSLPMLSSHEHLCVVNQGSRSSVRHFWGASFDDLALHCLHQFVAGMIEVIIAQTGAPSNEVGQIEMQPHPERGLDFLKDQFSGSLVQGSRVLSVRVKNAALDSRFRNGKSKQQSAISIPPLDSLRATNLSGTTRVLIRSMLETGTPTLDDLATTTNLSARNFQRDLAKEGTGFRQLLDEVRRESALEWLEEDRGSVAELAYFLGYSHSSALTRAMFRWVGETPKNKRDAMLIAKMKESPD